ncbi:hypothetical protein BKA70DRAFT_1408952 [Coprinopsis sp. MPI-PUGE-AT-0042]|nr:hypothetical protein BKA70DRAFT_1408952 [Coprinopsis sp. MPI-PUGE-AT-0042]
MSQERRPVYENPLVHLPKPHPAVWKIQDTQALFVVAVADGQYIITAAEIAECIKIDQLLRKAQKPKRSTLTYDVFTTTFNENNTVDNRRFAYIDDSTNAIITTGDAISFTDFGITKQHTGVSSRGNYLTPERRKWLDNQLWINAVGNPSQAAPAPTPTASNSLLPPPPPLPSVAPEMEVAAPIPNAESDTDRPVKRTRQSATGSKKKAGKQKAAVVDTEDEAEPAAGPSASGMNIDA